MTLYFVLASSVIQVFYHGKCTLFLFLSHNCLYHHLNFQLRDQGKQNQGSMKVSKPN